LSKKKILFITGEFIPYTISIGGIIRVYSFINSLKNSENYILYEKKKYFGYFGLKKILKKKNIIHFSKNQKTSAKFAFRFILKFIRDFLYLLGLDNSFLKLKYYRFFLDKFFKKNKIDYIIISAPPFSLFYLVNYIKTKYPDIKIILDYRDGWSTRYTEDKFQLLKKFQIAKEKRILQFADYILCSTMSIHKSISCITQKKKVFFISNGFLKTYSRIKKKLTYKTNANKINIGYFGLVSDSANSYRDLNVIYESINRIRKFNIFFDFYGNSKIESSRIKNFSNFTFKKNLNYTEVLPIMKKYDYLLIMHTEKHTVKEVSTGKLFEYLVSQRPIIVLTNGKSEAGKIVKTHKVGLEIDYSADSLDKFFMNLKKKYEIQKNNKAIKFYSRDFQNIKLKKIIYGTE
jgi:hypothetical protein